MTTRNIRIKDRGLAPLRDIGIATQTFPRYSNDRLDIHRLDVVLLSFILRGNCVHRIESHDYPARGPSIGITHLNQTHCILTGGGDADIMNIYLDLDRVRLPRLPASLQERVPLLLPLNPSFLNDQNRVQQLDVSRDSTLPDIARLLDRELTLRGPGWEEASMSYFQVFLMELCRSPQIERLPSQMHPSTLRLERVRAHVDTHFRDPLTLAQLADVAGLGRTYLSRSFRAYAGKTLFTYIQERRIQAAMLELQQSDTKVIAIAANCGFSDLSHFNHCFRRFCGSSPLAYRHRFRPGAVKTSGQATRLVPRHR